MFVFSANYSLQGVLYGLLFVLLFIIVYLRDRKSQIENTVSQSELYNSFRTTFIQYKESAFNLKAKHRLSQEVGDYQPPWWYSPHIGTLFAFGYDASIKYETEVFENDDARFTVDWYPKKPPVCNNRKDNLNVIVFLPGLGLTSKNKFAQNFASFVASAGYTVAIVGSRGIDVPLKTHKFWHPGQHDDAYSVVDHIYHTYGNLQSRSTTKRGQPALSPQTSMHTAKSSTTNSGGKLRIFLTGYSAGSNVIQRVILHSRDKPCAEAIHGALCVCINYDYLTSRTNLESTFIGSAYSMLMTYAFKDVIRKNPHVHSSLEGGSGLVNRLLTSCTFMSDYDRLFAKHLHSYVSVDEMNSKCSMHDLHEIYVPLLAVQPSDDPLHMGRVRDNICLERVTSNPNLIYLEPQHGNHFGFYEGPLSTAFTNTTSYTYPARLAVTFFNTIVDHQNEKEVLQKGSNEVGSRSSLRLKNVAPRVM